jgi:hypothetical protein
MQTNRVVTRDAKSNKDSSSIVCAFLHVRVCVRARVCVRVCACVYAMCTRIVYRCLDRCNKTAFRDDKNIARLCMMNVTGAPDLYQGR